MSTSSSLGAPAVSSTDIFLAFSAVALTSSGLSGFCPLCERSSLTLPEIAALAAVSLF